MNTCKLNKISCCLLGVLGWVASPGGLAAADEVSQSEVIQQAVREAQQVAKEWASRLQEWKSGETRSTTYMGVVIESIPDVLRDYIELPRGVGLLLTRVAKDGPADKAGLVDNDILVNFDNQLVVNYSQLSTLIELKGPGATVPVKVLRKGKEMEFQVTLEERVRKGVQIMPPEPPSPPEVPEVPDLPGVPDPEKVGAWMEKVDEWIPGSVRVFIDQDEQVHVDLQALKEDMQDLQDKLKHIRVLQEDVPGLVKEYGDLGARTTIVHVADRNINYASKEGKVALTSSAGGRHAAVWDEAGNLIYEGVLPDDYASKLPDKAVRLIRSLEESGGKLKLDTSGQQLEIRLNEEQGEPLT
jgi:membrane-associated protease RseP (regulator of RpoE activity)